MHIFAMRVFQNIKSDSRESSFLFFVGEFTVYRHYIFGFFGSNILLIRYLIYHHPFQTQKMIRKHKPMQRPELSVTRQRVKLDDGDNDKEEEEEEEEEGAASKRPLLFSTICSTTLLNFVPYSLKVASVTVAAEMKQNVTLLIFFLYFAKFTYDAPKSTTSRHEFREVNRAAPTAFKSG